VRAAIIHLLGDCVQAVGVLLAALLIYFRPDWKIADPITTFVFAVLVLLTTVPIFLTSMRVLLEFAPEDMDTEELFKKINAVSKLKF
jgi:zinc transporter 2